MTAPKKIAPYQKTSPPSPPDTVTTSDTFEEFEGFGLSSDPNVRPLHERCIGIAAEPGGGKSALAQSEPNAIVIDVDQAGTVNPKPQAMLAPGVGKTIDVPHPRDDSKRVNTMGFDFVRAIVAKAVEIKKVDPDRPVVLWFDTMTSLVEARIRKLEVDNGTEGKIKPFDLMEPMRIWPIIARNINDLVDTCKQYRIGTRILFHITRSKETKFVRDPITKTSVKTTVTERAVNVPPSVFRYLTSRLDEGFILKTRVVMTPRTKKSPGGKIVKIGEDEKIIRYLEIDQHSEYDTISDFSKSKIPTLPDRIEWPDGDFDAWRTSVAPAFETAIIEFRKEQKE